jgi:serine/threonine protein kinase
MVNYHRMTLSDRSSLIPTPSSIAKSPLQDSSVQPKAYLNKRYRVLDLIGQGGFGKTFLAIEESHSVQSPCVIKQLFLTNQNTDLQQKAVEQFYQEALQLCELGSHSQIPQLLDFFEQDGYLYLVQEWIDGQNLEQELSESSPFNEAEIRQLLSELLPVLQFMHDHQVIHRDIKPANIIRRRVDQQLVLVDFGAAKYLTAIELMHTGTMIGSAEYTAPEQLKGKAVFSSDLYSLGVTCLHLLTQQSPFALFDSGEDVWRWREFLDEPVSESLGRILDKLLVSATRRRYQSASEVLNELNTLVKPISSEPRSPIVYNQPPQTWYYALPLEDLALAENTSRLSPRLAAAAATPPLQKAMSDEEEMAEINHCLGWIWRIATLTVITSLVTMTLIIIIASVESKFSTTAPKIETVQPVQGANSLGQR